MAVADVQPSRGVAFGGFVTVPIIRAGLHGPIVRPECKAQTAVMDRQVVFIGSFRIPDHEQWLSAMEAMSEFVNEHVPGARFFHAFANADGSEGTVIYAHPNAESLDQHLAAASELIRQGTDMVDVTEVRLLGSPNPATVERMLGAGVPVTVQAHAVGFERRPGG